MKKAIPNSNNTIKEEITKLITTGKKFGLNDELKVAQISYIFFRE